MTLSRQKPGIQQVITIGCWTGLLDDMASEVERRARTWEGTDEEKQRWRDEYALAEKLCRARMSMWATNSQTERN